MSSKNPIVLFGPKNSLKNKVESIRAFEIVYFTLKFQGLVITEDCRLRHKIHVVANYIFTNIFYYASFIIELFFVKNLRQLLENIPMNICVTACSVKFLVILRLRPSLIEMNEQLKHLDSRPMTDKQKDKLRKEINFCRLTSLMVAVFFLGVNLTHALAAALSHGKKLGFETWFPYDWSKNAFRYWVSLFIQTVFQLQLGLEDVANDFIGVLYLNVLSAHLQIIMERFANIHYDPEKMEEESFQDFVQCVEDHRIVMGLFEIIQKTLSFTIFIQFITSILVFSTTGLIYLRFSPSLTETAAVFLFMVAEITEIYPSCYYSNKFMEKTDQMVFMLYSSNWMDLSPKFRKHLIIFMQMTQERKIILAGKQIPVTLATFMSCFAGPNEVHGTDRYIIFFKRIEPLFHVF
ncbi:odorant receptor 33b-like isoform X1 [Hermetia illucens]|uniref:odorant receptor 33b-like isoform X1 n=1 Tax=Hermetia illucens TaxID=343691 RepID=UPI0018CC6C0B|nr:odorant receptor 33b-like isoform X1 [Hermetia illucens]